MPALSFNPGWDAQMGRSPFPFISSNPGTAGDTLVAALFIANDETWDVTETVPPIVTTNVEDIFDYYGWTEIHRVSTVDGLLVVMTHAYTASFIEWELTGHASWGVVVGAFPAGSVGSGGAYQHLLDGLAGEYSYVVPVPALIIGVGWKNRVSAYGSSMAAVYVTPPVAGGFGSQAASQISDLSGVFVTDRLIVWAYEPGDDPATFAFGFDDLQVVFILGDANPWTVGRVAWGTRGGWH